MYGYGYNSDEVFIFSKYKALLLSQALGWQKMDLNERAG